jgi:Zn-dependent protease
MDPLLIQQILMALLAFIIGVTLHEFGHAMTADRLGDDLPRLQGRISLNPLDHMDIMGTICVIATWLIGFGFGWGRPVLINPSRFKNPRMGDALVSVAGPLMNLLLATVFAVIIRTGYFGLPNSSPWHQFIDIALSLNILLFVFNLVPVPPLDGSHILADILPLEMSKKYQSAMARYGWILFFAVIFFGGQLIGPEVAKMHNLLAPGS